MEFLAFVVGVLAVVSLGLATGALLAEACVLVPMWRSQDPGDFLSWYQGHAGLLLRFFGPLEVASTVFILGAAGLALAQGLGGATSYCLSAALSLAVLASFPLYFKNANAGFADRSIPISEVPAALARWAKWHWARTILAIAAFLFAILGLAHGVYPPAA